MLESYLRLKGKHTGENAFIIGAGPSLYKELTNKRLDNRINDHVVVAVNSSCIIMDWDQGSSYKRYWISNDALCRRWSYWEGLKKSKCIKVVRDSWERYYKEIPDFLQFSPRPTSEGVINPEDEGLCYCSSVPSAVDLCLQMGCKRVFVLGVDHSVLKGKTHFWQFFDTKDRPFRFDRGMATLGEQNNAFRYNDLAYPALRGFADRLGAKVYNCNPNSRAIDVFDKIELEEALRMASEDGTK